MLEYFFGYIEIFDFGNYYGVSTFANHFPCDSLFDGVAINDEMH